METHFEDLRESNEFLHLLLENMNSAVLLVDENLQIHHFNDGFLQLFAKSKEDVFVQRFGKAMGCAYGVRENKPCGETSNCDNCVLRRSALKTLVEKVPVDKMGMERVFYIDGIPTTKYLQLSTRHVTYQGRKMIVVMMYDVTALATQKIELHMKQEQLDGDLAAAAGIQQSLLPSYSPHTGAMKIAWKFEPHREIGGDIFNVVHPEKDRIDLYMLDVCGHGVPAALIAVSVSQYLHSQRGWLEGGHGAMSPEIVLNSLNQAFPFERFDSYFTIVHMSVDLSRGLLTYSCAGHPPPIILRADGVLETLDRRGPAIGLNSDKPYGQEEKELQKGDKVVLYTDGILEAFNPSGEIFGKDRFYEALQKLRHSPVQDIVEALYTEVKDFAKTIEFNDDITILIAEYLG